MLRTTLATATLVLSLGLACARAPLCPTGAPDDRATAAPATSVFEAGQRGYHTFRIPALLRAGPVLLAFAEGRVTGPGDAGDIDLVVRRSLDDGATWEPLQVLVDVGADSAANPAPVFDLVAGRVLLLHTRAPARDFELRARAGLGGGARTVWSLASADGGATWSPAREISAEAMAPDWLWYATGPGHGIQLRHGPVPGRLLVPANHSRAGGALFGILGGLDDALLGAHALLSDDGGQTWRIGAVDRPETGRVNPNESTAAELLDGRVFFASRDQHGRDPGNRAVAWSTDAGEHYHAPFAIEPALVSPVVQASLLQAGSHGREHLLIASPTHPEARCDLGLRASRDGGATWSAARVVAPGPAAYSDLAQLRGGDVGLLYEVGDATLYERIDFLRVPADELP